MWHFILLLIVILIALIIYDLFVYEWVNKLEDKYDLWRMKREEKSWEPIGVFDEINTDGLGMSATGTITDKATLEQLRKQASWYSVGLRADASKFAKGMTPGPRYTNLTLLAKKPKKWWQAWKRS